MATIDTMMKHIDKKLDKRTKKFTKKLGTKAKRKSRKGKWGSEEDTLLWNVGTGSGASKLW
jgi:hypothetical protein